MIDYRQHMFDSSGVKSITLVMDRQLGFGILGRVASKHAFASLERETRFEAAHMNLDDDDATRFFIPNCSLRFDPTAVVDPRHDPPEGTLIVAPAGISLMVRPPKSGPVPLCLTGEPLKDAYQGFCISKWRILPSETEADQNMLFEFNTTASARSVPLSGI